jgi:hypothetical protein
MKSLAQAAERLVVGHVADLGGADLLSEAQFSLIRRAAAIETELERLDAQLSRGEPVDMDSYARVAGHLRRLFETIGLKRVPRDVMPSLGEYLDRATAGVEHDKEPV